MFGFGKSRTERLEEKREKEGKRLQGMEERYKVMKDTHRIEERQQKIQAEADQWRQEKMQRNPFVKAIKSGVKKSGQYIKEERKRNASRPMNTKRVSIRSAGGLGGAGLMGSMGMGSPPKRKRPRNLIDL